MDKFKVGDTVWYMVLESLIDPEISVERHTVIKVYHRNLYVLNNGCDTDNFEGNPVNECDLYATAREARAAAVKFVREQIEAWQKVLKGLEDA